mmetsp:Transcript_16296/g.32611  ORF Transcript_16296/g.32611 Transcript_16296/m.32611 type:complete len:103 (+) Transcript_16296:117-425(+)
MLIVFHPVPMLSSAARSGLWPRPRGISNASFASSSARQRQQRLAHRVQTPFDAAPTVRTRDVQARDLVLGEALLAGLRPTLHAGAAHGVLTGQREHGAGLHP